MVKAGDIVKVKVLEVDLARKRIALTMRLSDAAAPRREAQAPGAARSARGGRPPSGGARPRPAAAPAPRPAETAPRGAMAEALARALKR